MSAYSWDRRLATKVIKNIISRGRVNARTWLRCFLNRNLAISARYSTPMDCQRAFANHPGPIKDYFK